MDTSILMAKFWGWFLLLLGLLFLVRPKAMDKIFEFAKDEKFVFLLGFITFLIGLVNILLHNYWIGDWRGIITLFGWMALLKGLIRMGFNETSVKFIQSYKFGGDRWMLVLVVGLGAFLLYCAYF